MACIFVFVATVAEFIGGRIGVGSLERSASALPWSSLPVAPKRPVFVLLIFRKTFALRAVTKIHGNALERRAWFE
jgi:hypothetical protein